MSKKILLFALAILACNAHAGLLCYGYKYAHNLVAAVQTTLSEQGFYQGAIDGLWGPKTKEAVRKFQVAKNIQVRGETWGTLDSDEGELEPQTLRALLGDEAPEGGVERVKNPNGVSPDIWERYCR